MDVPANPDADADRPVTESTTPRTEVVADDISVRKEASNYTDDAVAVELVIRSERDGPAVVRVTDRLPAAVEDHPVEFHPNFDPSNWSREGDRCVYQAVVEPGTIRRTVYGVTVDDPSAVTWFATEPTVEVIYHGASAVRDAGDRPTMRDGDGDGDRGGDRDGGSVVPSGDGESTIDEAPSDRPSATEPAAGFAFGGADDERSAVDGNTAPSEPPPASTEASERGLSPAPPDDIVERVDDLEAEVDALHRRLEREIAWRVRLQQSLAADVGQPGSSDDD